MRCTQRIIISILETAENLEQTLRLTVDESNIVMGKSSYLNNFLSINGSNIFFHDLVIFTHTLYRRKLILTMIIFTPRTK